MTSEIILQAIVTGLMMGLIYALIAAGLSLIFGLMDIVNFAHGEHLMLSMFSSFWLWSLFGLDPIFSIPITILLMAFCGVITHYFLIRYILKAKMLIQICATFGLSIFIRSIAQLLWTPDFRNVDKPLLEGRLEIGSVFIGQPQLVASLVCLVAFIGLYLFVTKTETGLALQATAQDRHAAEILGIPSNKMFAIGWAIGLGCVGVAGGMMANYFFIFTDVGINFAHGEHLMLSMFSSFWLWSLFGLDPIFSIPITILLMAFCGVITHYFLIRYILKAKMLIQICATFGLSIFIRSIAQLLWTPDFRNVDKPLLEGRLEIGSVFIGQPQLIASLVCLVAFIGLYLFVTKTETGLALQATAQDRHAAEILGIPSNKMFAIGWAIGLGCVGVAGGMMANYFFIFTDVGINFALFAFVAVALGGFGSIIGCLYAGIIIGLVESLGGLLIDPSFKLLYVFVIYLIVVIYRPQGLFGRY